jgi:hypothetical protein
MAPLGWVVTIAGFAIVVYAIYKRLDVKVGLKIPFVAFSFEAKDHENDPATKQIEAVGSAKGNRTPI